MDANVLNCSASTVGGKREQLIDQFGCVQKPDLMTFFDKSRTSNGVQADLMLYSYIKVRQILIIFAHSVEILTMMRLLLFRSRVFTWKTALNSRSTVSFRYAKESAQLLA